MATSYHKSEQSPRFSSPTSSQSISSQPVYPGFLLNTNAGPTNEGQNQEVSVLIDPPLLSQFLQMMPSIQVIIRKDGANSPNDKLSTIVIDPSKLLVPVTPVAGGIFWDFELVNGNCMHAGIITSTYAAEPASTTQTSCSLPQPSPPHDQFAGGSQLQPQNALPIPHRVSPQLSPAHASPQVFTHSLPEYFYTGAPADSDIILPPHFMPTMAHASSQDANPITASALPIPLENSMIDPLLLQDSQIIPNTIPVNPRLSQPTPLTTNTPIIADDPMHEFSEVTVNIQSYPTSVIQDGIK